MTLSKANVASASGTESTGIRCVPVPTKARQQAIAARFGRELTERENGPKFLNKGGAQKDKGGAEFSNLREGDLKCNSAIC